MISEREQFLLDEIARRDARIALLEQKLDLLVRRIFGAKSETLDAGQLELLLEDEAAKKPDAAGSDDAPAAEVGRAQRIPRKPHAPRLPESLPVEEEIIDPLVVRATPEAWRCIGSERREQLDYQPGRFFLRVLVRRKFVRRDDPVAKPVIAPLPASLQERCIAAPGLIAQVIVAKYVDHLPLYRQEAIYARRHGVRLPRKTLCAWTELAADWLGCMYRTIEREHRESPYLQIDETPIDYLKPGAGKAMQGYLWTSYIPGGTVLYQWHAGRSHACLAGLLQGGPRRIVQCDGYGAYKTYAAKEEGITLAGCHAHMRRKFHEARGQAPKLVGWILRQIGALYRIEAQMRDSRAGPAMRAAIRASQSRMIHQRLKRCFDMLSRRRSVLPKSLLGTALSYALNQWRELEVFLCDGRVEIDNNLVENAIRPTKLGAKNWLFIGSEESGAKAAVLYTIVENCRRLGIDPQEYLTDVLTRLPGMTNHGAADLTPAKWLQAKRTRPSRAA